MCMCVYMYVRVHMKGCSVLEIKKEEVMRLLRQNPALRDHFDASALGLKWANRGSFRPLTCMEISNLNLSLALEKRNEFTRDQFALFGVHGLTYDCFIRVKGCYFIPEKPSYTNEAQDPCPTASFDLFDSEAADSEASEQEEADISHPMCLPPHSRVQAVAIAVGWNDQALKKVEFVSSLSRKELQRMRLWSGVPEPATAKHYLVLPDSGTFISQVSCSTRTSNAYGMKHVNLLNERKLVDVVAVALVVGQRSTLAVY